MIIEISIAIIALAFLGLAIYLIFVLKELRSTLKNVNKAMATIEPQLSLFASETNQLVNTSNHIALDLQHKIESFNPLFKTVSEIGEGIDQRICHFRKKSEFQNEKINGQESFDTERLVYKVVDLMELGIIFWQTLKKRS